MPTKKFGIYCVFLCLLICSGCSGRKAPPDTVVLTKTERELFPLIWAREYPEPPAPPEGLTWGEFVEEHYLPLRELNRQHNLDKAKLREWREK